MLRKIWFFLAILTLLLGLEIIETRSVVLTAETTKILAQQSEKLEKRRKLFEAFMGNKYQYQEQEVPLNHAFGYGLLVFSGIGFMHSILLSRERGKKER